MQDNDRQKYDREIWHRISNNTVINILAYPTPIYSLPYQGEITVYAKGNNC